MREECRGIWQDSAQSLIRTRPIARIPTATQSISGDPLTVPSRSLIRYLSASGIYLELQSSLTNPPQTSCQSDPTHIPSHIGHLPTIWASTTEPAQVTTNPREAQLLDGRSRAQKSAADGHSSTLPVFQPSPEAKRIPGRGIAAQRCRSRSRPCFPMPSWSAYVHRSGEATMRKGGSSSIFRCSA